MRLVVATLLMLTAPALAGRASVSPSRPRVKAAPVDCREAGRAVLAPVDFDKVRVVVAETMPGAAVDVTVLAGSADRRVRARGGGAWSLRMDAVEATGPVLVAIEPSLDAPAGACVERVELLRDERVVADVRVR